MMGLTIAACIANGVCSLVTAIMTYTLISGVTLTAEHRGFALVVGGFGIVLFALNMVIAWRAIPG